MANDLFTRAKAYRKKHPKTAWQDCVKACAGKKRAAVGKAKRKAPKTIVRAKVAVVGKVKKASPVKKAIKSVTKALGIGGIAMGSIKHDQQCIARHTRDIDSLKRKMAGMPVKDKAHVRRDIARHMDMIRSHKQSINSHKKHL